jgi:hypothetical protein
MEKTGYSRRMLTKAIKSLESKGIITITGRKGNLLNPRSRKGSWLYLSYKHVQFPAQRSALLGHEEVHQSAHNKTNKTKLIVTKLRERSSGVVFIGEVIAKVASNRNQKQVMIE